MKVIGVSGYIGSGKTTMLEYLSNNPKIKIIEADKVSKEILYDNKIMDFLKIRIPNVIVNKEIDRAILRTELFQNHELNESFTSIAWPLISDKINEEIMNKKNAELIFVEAAVISGINVKFDKTILLTKNRDARIIRVNRRDNRDYKEIESITDFQRAKLKNYKFDFILENNSNKKLFFERIDSLIKEINES